MTLRLLTQVSAFVLLATLPALAAETPKTDAAITEAVQAATDSAKEAYEKIKAAMVSDNEDKEIKYVTIDTRMTALGILGQSIVNNEAVALGTAEDIILNADGKADAIIITHGGYFKFGSKTAAFDYDLVMRRESDGDVVMPLTTEAVDKAKAFSYDRANASDKIRVMAESAMSVKELLKGSLMDHAGNVVAKTENIYFKDGQASRVIFSFDQTMGMGGEKVTIDYAGLQHVKAEDMHHFKMNEKQSMQFENFRKTVTQ